MRLGVSAPRSGGSEKSLELLGVFEVVALGNVFENGPSLPRAVILHDSFSVTLAPCLAEHFSSAVFRGPLVVH